MHPELPELHLHTVTLGQAADVGASVEPEEVFEGPSRQDLEVYSLLETAPKVQVVEKVITERKYLAGVDAKFVNLLRAVHWARSLGLLLAERLKVIQPALAHNVEHLTRGLLGAELLVALPLLLGLDVAVTSTFGKVTVKPIHGGL